MVENRSRREFLSRITVAAGTFALAGKLITMRFEVRSAAEWVPGAAQVV